MTRRPAGTSRRPEEYDRALCLLPRDVVEFVLATQPREWVVRNGLGARAGTCIDPKIQLVQAKTVCLVSCQRSPEPVFLKWKATHEQPDGDFYVRSGPRTDRLGPESAQEYIRTRFEAARGTESKG